MGESSLKEKAAKGLFWGGVGNTAFQLLNLVIGIFLGRLLDASDYGMMAMAKKIRAAVSLFIPLPRIKE